MGHFSLIDDPGIYRRILSPEQAQRVIRMKDERGLSWCAIAGWFSRNGTPISYQAVRETYGRTRRAA